MKLLKKYVLLMFFTIFIFEIHAQEEIKFEQPVLITSAGQSADVKLAGLIFNMQKLRSTTTVMAKTGDLKDVKTLVVVPGFSSKGLGAAGVSVEDEMKRVTDSLAKAKEENIPVLLMHIGGSARRKGQSDNFIKIVAEASKYMIVVKQGDEDGFFTNLSDSLKIPLEFVEKIPEAAQPVAKLFK